MRRSDIDVLGSIRFFHDELEASLGVLAHQIANRPVGIRAVVIGNDNLEQPPARRDRASFQKEAAPASRLAP